MDSKSSPINTNYNNQSNSDSVYELPNTNIIYSKYGIDISVYNDDYSNVYINQIASVRTANALASINIKTLEDLFIYLAKNGDYDLRYLRNFGKKCHAEIFEILDSFGITINDLESVGNVLSDFSLGNFDNVPQDNDKTLYIPNIPLSHLGKYCDYVKDLVTSGISTTRDLFILFDTYGIVDLYKAYEFANDTSKKILTLLAIIQDRNRWNELLSMVVGKNTKLWSISPILRSSNYLFANTNNNLLEDTLKAIQKQYIESICALSVRAYNVLKYNMPNFSDLIIFTLLYRERFKFFKNCGKNTWNEISLFATKFYVDISTLTNSLFDGSSICLHQISYSCSSETEEQFISEFYNKNGYLPMFNILSSYLCKSENRFERFYRSIYGIQCESLDYKQVAEQNGISYERVRQIISKGEIENKLLVKYENWYRYQIDQLLYISQNNELYKTIIDSEHLNKLTIVGFGYLCNLLIPFKHISVKGNDYFFSKKLFECFDIKGALEDIENTLSKRVVSNVVIPISFFSDSYWISKPDFEPSEVLIMLRDIILDNFNVRIDNDLRITIHQNSIDISLELYHILKDYGKPLSIEDMFSEFKKKFPNHKYDSAAPLRSYLIKNDKICSIGKSSCYALKEWNIFTGTIRDLIYETLLKSDLPLTAEELCALIREVYETSPKSVRSTVVADKGDKFVFFKNGYIGLKSKSYPDEYSDVTLSRKPRQSFQDSLDEYERYLATHHHMPFSTGTEVEQFLYKWYGNVIGKRISLNVKQEADFNAMIERNKEYMVNGIEYAFFRRCDDYKVFLEENMELPTLETDPALYNWFQTQIKKYTEFEDRRYGYFEDLLKDIESYGFIVNINKDKGPF